MPFFVILEIYVFFLDMFITHGFLSEHNNNNILLKEWIIRYEIMILNKVYA